MPCSDVAPPSRRSARQTACFCGARPRWKRASSGKQPAPSPTVWGVHGPSPLLTRPAPSPGASGRADALLRRTATLPNEGAGDEDSSELLARLGSGDAAAVAAVRGLGTFLVPPPRTCTAPFHATFTAPSGATGAPLPTL